MSRRARRVELRSDIRTEASLVGWVCVGLAVLSWSFLARALFGAGCGDGCTTPPAGDGRVVLWLALGVAGTVGAAAAYVVSAVARLLAADPEPEG